MEVAPGTVAAVPLSSALTTALRAAGYVSVIGYDPVSGFRPLQRPGESPSAGAALLTKLGLTVGSDGTAPAGPDLFSDVLARVAAGHASVEGPIALVADFASCLVVRTDALSNAEHQMFTRALVLSHQARARPCGTPPRPFFNTVIWIVDKEGDLPDWLVVDNSRIRHVPVAAPDHLFRRQLASMLLPGLDGSRAASPAEMDAALDALVEQTEGLLLVDLSAIIQLGRSEGLSLQRVGDAVRRYKVGVTEDPWARIERDKVRHGADFIRARVKGQDHAVTHVLDIVKRAVTGVGAPRRGSRPRGVAVLAGPGRADRGRQDRTRQDAHQPPVR